MPNPKYIKTRNLHRDEEDSWIYVVVLAIINWFQANATWKLYDFQFIQLMQLNPNSIKMLTAIVILNEKEYRGVTCKDLLFALFIKKTPSIGDKRLYTTYSLAMNNPISKKYFIYFGKLAVDKIWDTFGGLYIISGEWISPHLSQ